MQPRLGEVPIAYDGERRNIQNTRCLFDTEPTEKPKLDDFSLSGHRVWINGPKLHPTQPGPGSSRATQSMPPREEPAGYRLLFLITTRTGRVDEHAGLRTLCTLVTAFCSAAVSFEGRRPATDAESRAVLDFFDRDIDCSGVFICPECFELRGSWKSRPDKR